jgi:ketosteroid isomerase-like protein
MPEESATPDLEETLRRGVEAFNRRDFDAFLAAWAPDAVWELSSVRMGVFEMSTPTGHAAIQKVVEEYPGAFDDFQTAIEEAHDLGNGVTIAVIAERARPPGSSGFLERRYGLVATWRDGRIARAKNYLDIDEARAAAERLAEERKYTVSEESS